ncbi:MAG: membrane dipeptidase [Anaerolineales bacterium]
MSLIVDSHEDLAWNILSFERDYTRSAYETRRLEQGNPIAAHNGDTLLGWPEYQQGQVAVVFSTLFSTPARWAHEWETLVYRTPQEAHHQYRQQLDLYHRLTDDHADKFYLLTSASLLDEGLARQQQALSLGQGYPVGLLPLMEGAEGVLTPNELAAWWQDGLRIIGPAWAGTRFCGGTREPGPLTAEGRNLLAAMAEFPFILDLSHMDETAALEALDRYPGPVIVTHANCASLLTGYQSNRHLSDRLIRGLVERDGIIGVIPYNAFLKVGWLAGKNERHEVGLEHLTDHIDHICQLSGDARHAGIGTDFDGGFGVQSVPHQIDTIADLQKLIPLLLSRGYAEEDAAAILGGNWLRSLHTHLPPL